MYIVRMADLISRNVAGAGTTVKSNQIKSNQKLFFLWLLTRTTKIRSNHQAKYIARPFYLWSFIAIACFFLERYTLEWFTLLAEHLCWRCWLLKLAIRLEVEDRYSCALLSPALRPSISVLSCIIMPSSRSSSSSSHSRCAIRCQFITAPRALTRFPSRAFCWATLISRTAQRRSHCFLTYGSGSPTSLPTGRPMGHSTGTDSTGTFRIVSV